MSTPSIDWVRFAEVYNDIETYPRLTDVADALDLSRQKVRSRVEILRRLKTQGQDVPELIDRKAATLAEIRAAETGELGFAPVLPGYTIKKTSTQLGPEGELQREWIQQTKAPGEEAEVPRGHTVKGVSMLVDEHGRSLLTWIKTREGATPEDAVAIIRDGFKDFEGRALPSPAPHVSANLLTLIPCNDWHIGMYAWGRETGQDWNLKLAETVIGDAMVEVIGRTPASDTAVVLVGGDLLHSDNSQNRTAKSGNALDVDGRYPEVLQAACRVMIRTVDAAVAHHGKVIVRVLPGNHDEHTAVAVAYFLLAWYRDEPRVTVDVDPSLFFWLRFGSVLIGATHGHSVKLKDMPAIMAHRRAADWGQTRFRYVHGFHIHHKEKHVTEGEGVTCEAHQAPIPQDAWHFGSGFLSGRSVQAITYHRDYGETSRARVAILDAEANKAA